MRPSNFTLHLGSHTTPVTSAIREMGGTQLIAKLWAKDHRLWKSEPTEITNRLGWLSVAEQMLDKVSALQAFAKSVRDEGYRDVVLLGMGGSSLGPEVLRCTFGSAKGWPQCWVLDSTVPGAVRQVTKAISPAKTLFLVASKSGGTIEVMSLFAHFSTLVSGARGNRGGAQFVAITDPGTSLGELAQAKGFRTTFINPADIGGRYSVLSYFGLVPAALMGLDVELLLRRAVEMARQCGATPPPPENPGAVLGTSMGVLGRAGRDKVTIITSPKLSSFGLWAEQLLAESTGKEGRGLVPIAQEPLGPPSVYGPDRLFVYLRLNGDANATTDRRIDALQRGGQPVIRLTLRDRYDLAAEFFRWEFATAVAGHYLGIHPFDQPNVQESKENTARILKEVQEQGRRLDQDGGSEKGLDALRDVVAQAGPGKYLAILAYVTPSRPVDAAIAALRKHLLLTHRLPTTAGYGPRYLHSTGQLHKGGANHGLFVELVEDMKPDLPIPEKPFSFGTLAQAQAVGDHQSLQTHARVVVRIAVGRQADRGIRALGNGPGKARKPTSVRRRATAQPARRKRSRR